MPDGLERRYHVERLRYEHRPQPGAIHGDSDSPVDVVVRREPVEDFCFVLRPERDEAAQVAVHAYADEVEDTHPDLAADLRRWMADLTFRATEEAFKGPRDDGNRGFR